MKVEIAHVIQNKTTSGSYLLQAKTSFLKMMMVLATVRIGTITPPMRTWKAKVVIRQKYLGFLEHIMAMTITATVL